MNPFVTLSPMLLLMLLDFLWPLHAARRHAVYPERELLENLPAYRGIKRWLMGCIAASAVVSAALYLLILAPLVRNTGGGVSDWYW